MLRTLVMGCGGIGGICAAHLMEAGQNVRVYSSNREIAAAVQQKGFRLVGERPRSIAGQVDNILPEGPFDVILLATQPPQVEAAAKSALPLLAPQGRMVCLQNGLCEARIAKIVGPERVAGAVVGWGASMPEVGVFDRTAEGTFSIGYPDGRQDTQLEELNQLLRHISPCEKTTNLAGRRWSKLALNAAVSSLGAVGGDRLGVLMQLRIVRRLALELMTETVMIAEAEHVQLENISKMLDLKWLALNATERQSSGSVSLFAKHTVLLTVGFHYRRMRSSMLSALERGREPATDFLNGEIVTRGEHFSIPTPVNAAIQKMIWEIYRKERQSSVASLQELFETTRLV